MSSGHDRQPPVAASDCQCDTGAASTEVVRTDAAEESAVARELRRSEERYRALASASAQIVWTTNAAGQVEEDAPAWRAYTGQSLSEVNGLGWLDALHPDDRARASQAWSRAGATKSPYEIEYRIRRADGIYRTFAVRVVPVLEADGSIREWVGAGADITARKEAEEERAQLLAREREARAVVAAQARQLEAIFETMTDAVYVYDDKGSILRMNSAARALLPLGIQPDYLERAFAERVTWFKPGDEQGEFLAREQWPLPRILHGEVLTGTNTVDVVVRGADGRVVRYNISGAPVRDDTGQIVGAVCVCRDATQQCQLEQRTNDALDALLAMAEALVHIPDGAGPATERSPTAASAVARRLAELTCRVLECQRAAIITIDPTTEELQLIATVGLSSENEQHLQAMLQKSRLSDGLDPAAIARLAGGEALTVDLTQPPFQGRLYSIDGALLVPLLMGERLTGILGLSYGSAEQAHVAPESLALARAVARLVALVIERERLLDERAEGQVRELALREANRRMDEFLAIATHELRTPLTSIKGNIQLALRRFDGRMAQGVPPEPLQRIERQVNRLARLIDDLLDVSRIQAGHLNLRLAPVDLAVIVREIVEEQRQEHPTWTITLDLGAMTRVPVVADAGRIGQVVTNYLMNALKYSPADRPIAVGLSIAEQMARVLVRDEGPGLSAVEQEQVWERFHQVKESQSQSGASAGLGLGLYISRSIIEQHRGQVGVQSAPGQGSTFWFTLPLAREAP
jgi:PAS domain S-box-containing protein